MKMAETDDRLESFFAAGRAAAETPSEALLARIEADALATLDARRAADMPASPARGLGGMFALLGGWRAGAGLVASTVAGLAIGIGIDPAIAGLDSLPFVVADYDLGDLAPGYGAALWEEG